MTAHRIDLLPLPKRHGKTPMVYNGKAIGVANSPIYAAARWLLDNGLAWPDDIVETYRGETLSMRGKAGELAKWTVEEEARGKCRFQLVPWEPFPGGAVAPRTENVPTPVHSGVCQPGAG